MTVLLDVFTKSDASKIQLFAFVNFLSPNIDKKQITKPAIGFSANSFFYAKLLFMQNYSKSHRSAFI